MIEFTMTGRLPGINDYVNAERAHRLKGNRMKRDSEDDVITAILIRGLKSHRLKTPVRIEYKFVEKDRRRDKDNISGFAHKVVQDALVKTGLLDNDGWDEIDGYSDAFGVDKGNPRIEVKIYEKGEYE